MSKPTQTFKLYEVLKSGEAISVDQIAKELSIEIKSVPVYVHGLKKLKADISPVRVGRKVTAYRLLNAADVKVSEFRKNTTTPDDQRTKSVEVRKADASEDTGPVIPLSDREIEDVHTSLSIDVTPNNSWE